MKQRPPLDKGGLQGGFGRDRHWRGLLIGTHPERFRRHPSDGGDFQRALHPECYASIFFTTLPATSVSRNSRPICL